MSGGATFEERIGEVLAELYDGASLMTGDASGRRTWWSPSRPKRLEHTSGSSGRRTSAPGSSALERSAPARFDEVLRTSIERLSLERRTAVWLVDRMGFD